MQTSNDEAFAMGMVITAIFIFTFIWGMRL